MKTRSLKLKAAIIAAFSITSTMQANAGVMVTINTVDKRTGDTLS